MRAAMFDHVLPLSDGVGVRVVLEGTAEPLTQESVTPERLRGNRGWIVMRATIPAGTVARVISVRVDAGPANNPNSDWCALTPPVLVDKAP
jgi:hypothetical protein